MTLFGLELMTRLFFQNGQMLPHTWYPLKHYAISAPLIRDATTTLEVVTLALLMSKLPVILLAVQTELCIDEVQFSDTKLGRELSMQLGDIEQKMLEEEQNIRKMTVKDNYLPISPFDSVRRQVMGTSDSQKELKAKLERRKHEIDQKRLKIQQARGRVYMNSDELKEGHKVTPDNLE